jgi:hypothetical protein
MAAKANEKAGKQGKDGHVEKDRDKYDKAGKEKDSKALRDIPSGRLRDYMKRDNDAWRAGKAKLELDRRQKERDAYGKGGSGKGGKGAGGKSGGAKDKR